MSTQPYHIVKEPYYTANEPQNPAKELSYIGGLCCFCGSWDVGKGGSWKGCLLCVGMCVHIDFLYRKSALSYCERALSHEKTLSSLFMRQLGRVCFACVAVCCSVLQCVAECLQCVYSVFTVGLQYVCSVLQWVAVCCSVCAVCLQCVAVCCSVMQCVTACCSVSQCVAVCCSVLQCVAVCCSVSCP